MVKQNTAITLESITMSFLVLALLVILGFIIYFLVKRTRENYKKTVLQSNVGFPQPIKVGTLQFPSENVRQIMLPPDLVSYEVMRHQVPVKDWEGVY